MILKTNLLKSAMKIIDHGTVQYRRYQSRTITDFAVISPNTYGDWTTVDGLVQPGIVSSFGGSNIELKDYKELGLDWSHMYITVWMPGVVLTNTVRGGGSDQIKYNSKIFTVLQVENWLEYDGWIRAYCVENITETEAQQ